jgi:hypothetical protein
MSNFTLTNGADNYITCYCNYTEPFTTTFVSENFQLLNYKTVSCSFYQDCSSKNQPMNFNINDLLYYNYNKTSVTSTSSITTYFISANPYYYFSEFIFQFNIESSANFKPGEDVNATFLCRKSLYNETEIIEYPNLGNASISYDPNYVFKGSASFKSANQTIVNNELCRYQSVIDPINYVTSNSNNIFVSFLNNGVVLLLTLALFLNMLF